MKLEYQKEDFDRGGIRFVALDGGERVRCLITDEALYDHFNADQQGTKDAFLSHRNAIAAAVEEKWDADDFEDGMIILRNSDF